MTGKDLRLLGREQGAGAQPDIHETIAALKAELARGASVYTPEELAHLARKLDEYEEHLRHLQAP
jgi:hypothetical protein